MGTPVCQPINGFAPLLGSQPKVLILGSMPSVASLQSDQYYGHPRNRFWPLMAELLKFSPDLAYSQRVDQLITHHLAVWDVLAQCVRPGSADLAIEPASEVVNPIAQLLHQQPQIAHIYFNGGAAQRCFSRHLGTTINIPCTLLPSTSPANAAWSLPRLLSRWSDILSALHSDPCRTLDTVGSDTK